MANNTQTCTTCSKQFLVIEKEQQYLKEKGLGVPTHCHACRQTRRLKLRGERTLYKAKCAKCSKDIVVSYNPANIPNQILCKQDYDKYFLENDPIITDSLPDA